MSLSAGQQAILRALREGRRVRLTDTDYGYRATVEGQTVPSGPIREMIHMGWLSLDRSIPTLTPAGHAALRALEQEAGG